MRNPMTLLRTPMDLWHAVRELPLVETVEALAQLPRALEEQMREANRLIGAAQEHLSFISEATGKLVAQLETMGVAADKLAEATPAMVDMASTAKEQMELTTVQLERTNEHLAEVLRVSEPLEKVGKRVQKFLDRRGGSDADALPE